ncbi:P2X purinoceptor 1 isoform X1 [Orcinus orca]|uniref:P2X purinoceptor 1 isoform X1 n=1 Tax=Orcinus orca TaxID=9733 RepID=UPI0014416AFF|nr:P2X purinoceptor 1 isoform X1 [Orcinus orca]
MARRLQDELAAFFFEYDTPRMVLVRNKKVGVIFRLIQLVVLVYVIGWVFVYEKGYQTSSGLISSVSVKLKGLAVTKLPSLGPQVWDVADYVFPAQGDNSFVVMTNFIATPRQAQGHCAENPEGGTCTNNSGCTPGKAERKAQGIRTGKCVAFNDIVHTCEIFGWCPVEVDDNIPCPALLREAENFTLFIKNSISFPRFKVTRRNLVEEVDAAYMKTCLYHKTLHPLCPVFKLGYMVQESGQNFSTLAEKGGVVGITIDWHCDLDWHVRHCKPVYEFHGLYEEKKLSQGFNFRFARHFVENGTNYRHLFKVFGIRFDILVDGKAGKFDIIPTMTTIGSGIGIFGVVPVRRPSGHGSLRSAAAPHPAQEALLQAEEVQVRGGHGVRAGGARPCGHQLHPGSAGQREDILTSVPPLLLDTAGREPGGVSARVEGSPQERSHPLGQADTRLPEAQGGLWERPAQFWALAPTLQPPREPHTSLSHSWPQVLCLSLWALVHPSYSLMSPDLCCPIWQPLAIGDYLN